MNQSVFCPVPSFPQIFDRACQKKHEKSPKHQGNRASAESSCVGLITDNTNSSCKGPTPGCSHKFHAEEWLHFAGYIGNHFPAKHITNLELQTTSLKWMFGETTIFHVKIWFVSNLKQPFFRVPGTYLKGKPFIFQNLPNGQSVIGWWVQKQGWCTHPPKKYEQVKGESTTHTVDGQKPCTN